MGGRVAREIRPARPASSPPGGWVKSKRGQDAAGDESGPGREAHLSWAEDRRPGATLVVVARGRLVARPGRPPDLGRTSQRSCSRSCRLPDRCRMLVRPLLVRVVSTKSSPSGRRVSSAGTRRCARPRAVLGEDAAFRATGGGEWPRARCYALGIAFAFALAFASGGS